MEASLQNEILDVWYPTAIDSAYSGFLSSLRYDWSVDPAAPQNKMLVTQTRHVWTTSEAAMFFEEDRYRDIAKHGVRFLKDKMWDQTHGGFFMFCNRRGGRIHGDFTDGKTAYGNAFAIYALTSYYELTGDTEALDLAKETFHWLERYSYDPEFGGYFDNLLRDGLLAYKSWSPEQLRETRYAATGWKDQNSSIHLLEAFTRLYQVWPDTLLQQRTLELLTLIRDTITTEKGYLTLFLQPDWTPVSFRDSSATLREANYYYDHVSFGHDVETAYLMLEAAHVLEQQRDKTLTVAKKMVDHALANGWDDSNGGFYYQGYYFDDTDSLTIISEVKTWWVQAEGLNALLMMSKLFPQETRYYDFFEKQWAYIQKYLIDHEHGGWYEEGLDKSPEMRKADKGSIWKINYHNGRALMNCIRMLRGAYLAMDSP